MEQKAVLRGLLAGVAVLAFLGGLVWVFSKAFHGYEIASRTGKANEDYQKAAALYEKKQFEPAAMAFRALRTGIGVPADVVKNATNGEVYCYRELGHLAQNQQDFATAVRWYAKALEVSPIDAQAKTEYEAALRALNARSAASLSGTSPPLPPAGRAGGGNTLEGGRAPVAPPPPPSNIRTRDFNNDNAQAAQQAQQLLAQGDTAFQSGNRERARELWNQAVMAGPGSPAARIAQDRIIHDNANNPAF